MSLRFSVYSNKPKNIEEIPWNIDTGGSNHIICDASLYSSIETQVHHSVSFPNGEKIKVTHVGTVKLTETLILNEVLGVPSFSFNLLFAKKFAQS